MSLSEKLGRRAAGEPNRREQIFDTYGIVANPFPPAGQPAGHPHLETEADETIQRRIQSFLEDQLSQVVVVEGEQGVGKTNLLTYVDREIRILVGSGQVGPYIARYYSDPEPSFEGVLGRLFQELGEDYIREIVSALVVAGAPVRKRVWELVRNQDVTTGLQQLLNAQEQGHENYGNAISHFFEWVTGHRLLNRHRDLLGVHYRVDTLESKTQVLRDLMEIGKILGVLKGIFLLLDELEKHDYTTSKTNVVRFLLAIRALIDALPAHLFLMVALTPTAKTRYFQMVPAVQSRMQNVIRLKSYKSWVEAKPLVSFYIGKSRDRARFEFEGRRPGNREFLSENEAAEIFAEKIELSRRIGAEGVTPRDFLDALHTLADKKLSELA